ncbi:MAG: DUF3037 domain-containing protein [Fimbriimonadaceae bacterium]|nr:DUF3037 domain-containing protein [Fimbriimonadaceae bacterium]
MSEHEYSYTILKYRPDAVAGEVMNIGVALFCRETGQVGVLFDHRYRRLSQAFARFDGEAYKRVLGGLTSALERLGGTMAGNLFELEERGRFSDVSALLRAAWPDQGLSYFTGSVSGGFTTDLDRELNELYDRFVMSQFDARDSSERSWRTHRFQ